MHSKGGDGNGFVSYLKHFDCFYIFSSARFLQRGKPEKSNRCDGLVYGFYERTSSLLVSCVYQNNHCSI